MSAMQQRQQMARTKASAALPAPPGRRERRRTETRTRILHAALQLFARHGFFGTTTEQITEAADVGQGTFFNYFPSKQHVFGVLAEIQLQKVRRARQLAARGEKPIRAVLEDLTQDIAHEPGRSQALARALFSAFLSSEAMRKMFAATLAKGRRDLAVIMALGQKRGEICASRKAKDLAQAFQRSVVGTLLLWAINPWRSLAPTLESAFQDFWAGASAGKGSVR